MASSTHAFSAKRPFRRIGSDGTVSGTAVTDWVDEKDKGNVETSAEEGKVEYRKTEEFRKKQEDFNELNIFGRQRHVLTLVTCDIA